MAKACKAFLSTFLIVLSCGLSLPLELQAQVFDPRGRRDPFVNLDELFREEQPEVFIPELPPLSERPLGLVGLAIEEVTITGVAVGEASKVVLLRGVDGFTYMARENSRLFDGYIFEISQQEVVFIQEAFDPRGNSENLRVVKRLISEEN